MLWIAEECSQLPLAHHQLEKLRTAFPKQRRMRLHHIPRLSLRKTAQVPDTQCQLENRLRDNLGESPSLFTAVYVAGRILSRSEEPLRPQLAKLQRG